MKSDFLGRNRESEDNKVRQMNTKWVLLGSECSPFSLAS